MRLPWPLIGRSEEMAAIEAAILASDASGIVVYGAAGQAGESLRLLSPGGGAAQIGGELPVAMHGRRRVDSSDEPTRAVWTTTALNRITMRACVIQDGPIIGSIVESE